jgi:hypothetical protein
MKYSVACTVVVKTVMASALAIMVSSGGSYAAKIKPIVVKAAQPSNQPAKLRYYGGPKSPMYP